MALLEVRFGKHGDGRPRGRHQAAGDGLELGLYGVRARCRSRGEAHATTGASGAALTPSARVGGKHRRTMRWTRRRAPLPRAALRGRGRWSSRTRRAWSQPAVPPTAQARIEIRAKDAACGSVGSAARLARHMAGVVIRRLHEPGAGQPRTASGPARRGRCRRRKGRNVQLNTTRRVTRAT